MAIKCHSIDGLQKILWNLLLQSDHEGRKNYKIRNSSWFTLYKLIFDLSPWEGLYWCLWWDYKTFAYWCVLCSNTKNTLLTRYSQKYFLRQRINIGLVLLTPTIKFNENVKNFSSINELWYEFLQMYSIISTVMNCSFFLHCSINYWRDHFFTNLW